MAAGHDRTSFADGRRPSDKEPKGARALTGSVDTHSYDGLLAKNILPAAFCPSSQEMQTKFTQLAVCIRLSVRVAERHRLPALEAICRIQSAIGGRANVDETDSYRADYLLAKLCDYLNDEDMLPYVAEQLSDIVTSGPCPQGRVKRILQCLLAVSCSK
jgi:hypothetical protein